MSEEKPLFVTCENEIVVKKEEVADLLRAALDANEAALFTQLMHLHQTDEEDDTMRQVTALSTIIEFMERLPLAKGQLHLLQPLNALRDQISPALGQGMREPSYYFLQGGGCAVVAALRAQGTPLAIFIVLIFCNYWRPRR